VSDLTDNLAKERARRDISLLALEHTLNPVQHKDHYHPNKLLLARIASYLITNPKLPGAEADQFRQYNNESTVPNPNTPLNKYEIFDKEEGDIKVATRILSDIIYKSEKKNCINDISSFLNVNSKAKYTSQDDNKKHITNNSLNVNNTLK